VHPKGDTVIVPEGASGPIPAVSGKGFRFRGEWRTWCIYTIKRSESVRGVSEPSPPTPTSQPLLTNLAD
jgi:hypothetical protein